MNVSPSKENILKKIRKALSQSTPLPFPKSEGNESVFQPAQQEKEIESSKPEEPVREQEASVEPENTYSNPFEPFLDKPSISENQPKTDTPKNPENFSDY